MERYLQCSYPGPVFRILIAWHVWNSSVSIRSGKKSSIWTDLCSCSDTYHANNLPFPILSFSKQSVLLILLFETLIFNWTLLLNNRSCRHDLEVNGGKGIIVDPRTKHVYQRPSGWTVTNMQIRAPWLPPVYIHLSPLEEIPLWYVLVSSWVGITTLLGSFLC
jgi:hypothetical protein